MSPAVPLRALAVERDVVECCGGIGWPLGLPFVGVEVADRAALAVTGSYR